MSQILKDYNLIVIHAFHLKVHDAKYGTNHCNEIFTENNYVETISKTIREIIKSSYV